MRCAAIAVGRFERRKSSAMLRRAVGVLKWMLLLVGLITFGCGWRTTMRFQSPSGRYAVEVLQTRIANEYGFRAVLRTNGASYQLCDIRREAIIYFVHVAWSQSESQVGVIASGFNY